MKVERVSGQAAAAFATAQLGERVMAGDVFVVRGLLQSMGWMERLIEMCRADLVALVGETRADEVVAEGFERIHEQLSVEELIAHNRILNRHMIPAAPLLVKDFAQKILKRRGTFAECHPNVRTIVPHDVAARELAAFTAEHRQRGAGKVTLLGPHYDSWHRHPLNTVNLWCAVGRVRPGNGMAIYPNLWGKHLPCDAQGRIRRDQFLGTAMNFALNPGDAVFFSANHLHGSELNRTDSTRFVVSVRMTLKRPVFPAEHAYRYVYSDWAGGKLDRLARLRVQLSGSFIRHRAIRMLKRMPGNAGRSYFIGRHKGFPPNHDTSRTGLASVAVEWDQGQTRCVMSARGVGLGEIRSVDKTFCVAHTSEGYVMFGRACPHEGADLAGGNLSPDGELVCPWHNLTFNFASGKSPCSSIARLRVIRGAVTGSTVRFDLREVDSLGDALTGVKPEAGRTACGVRPSPDSARGAARRSSFSRRD